MDLVVLLKRYRSKIVLLPFCLLFNLFYLPFAYFYYRRHLRQTTPQQQLFFLARDEYGVLLLLLYYVRCWTGARNGAVLVLFTPRIDLVKVLAKHICPAALIVSPDDWFSRFMRSAFRVYLRRVAFAPLYYEFLRQYPESLFAIEINKSNKSGYVKYLDAVYQRRDHDGPFWTAYVKTREIFDCRFDVMRDYFELAKTSAGVSGDPTLVDRLLRDLGIGSKYAIVNLNVKQYSTENQNIRRIWHHERYNVLINHLIAQGYSVVLQGRGEQPYFEPREGFFDYAHGNLQSAENDLLLFCGCEFFVASKTGAEWYGLVCDKPVLGLNYTELSSMQPNVRCRFFPKHARETNGRYLSWREFLAHPAYFQLGRILTTQAPIEFEEMEDWELVAAIDEFLELLPKPREQWLNYSAQQREFKEALHPGHIDLYHILGVPCEAYLNGKSKAVVAGDSLPSAAGQN